MTYDELISENKQLKHKLDIHARNVEVVMADYVREATRQLRLLQDETMLSLKTSQPFHSYWSMNTAVKLSLWTRFVNKLKRNVR